MLIIRKETTEPLRSPLPKVFKEKLLYSSRLDPGICDLIGLNVSDFPPNINRNIRRIKTRNNFPITSWRRVDLKVYSHASSCYGFK
jgi:hypothetical protein